jgi:hypothetical protein
VIIAAQHAKSTSEPSAEDVLIICPTFYTAQLVREVGKIALEGGASIVIQEQNTKRYNFVREL